jgi:hypothetical protein
MKADRGIPPTKEDVLAILRAHRELGPEYDTHLADQILDLWKHASYAPHDSRWDRRASGRRFRMGPILALSIPLMAVAGHDAGTLGVVGVLALDAVALIMAMVAR